MVAGFVSRGGREEVVFENAVERISAAVQGEFGRRIAAAEGSQEGGRGLSQWTLRLCCETVERNRSATGAAPPVSGIARLHS